MYVIKFAEEIWYNIKSWLLILSEHDAYNSITCDVDKSNVSKNAERSILAAKLRINNFKYVEAYLNIQTSQFEFIRIDQTLNLICW